MSGEATADGQDRTPNARVNWALISAGQRQPAGNEVPVPRVHQRLDRLVEQVAGDLIAGFLGDSGHTATQQPASRVEAEAVLEHLRVRQ